jgi:hypothetical protein
MRSPNATTFACGNCPNCTEAGPFWIGAATHDVGIVFRLRSCGFAHRVYSRIDEERAKVELDLASAAWVDITLIDHPEMPLHRRNATADHMETDGRLGRNRATDSNGLPRSCPGAGARIRYSARLCACVISVGIASDRAPDGCNGATLA